MRLTFRRNKTDNSDKGFRSPTLALARPTISHEIYGFMGADFWCPNSWLHTAVAVLGLGSQCIFLLRRCQEEAALIKHAKYDGAYHARRHITGEECQEWFFSGTMIFLRIIFLPSNCLFNFGRRGGVSRCEMSGLEFAYNVLKRFGMIDSTSQLPSIYMSIRCVYDVMYAIITLHKFHRFLSYVWNTKKWNNWYFLVQCLSYIMGQCNFLVMKFIHRMC